MSKILRYLPELEDEEQIHVARLMRDMTEEQAERFAQVYRQRRKDPTMTLLMALVGFLGIAGIHRFMLGQMVMGVLYLLTGGFCAIGTIIDLLTHKGMTYRYNIRQADQVAVLIESALPGRDDAGLLEA